jgi:hypothetical protein
MQKFKSDRIPQHVHLEAQKVTLKTMKMGKSKTMFMAVQELNGKETK